MYTSYFAKLKKLPEDIVPISICGKAPDWYTGLQYKKLAPKYKFFMEWKQNHDNDFYIEHFQNEVLDKLDVQTVYNELCNLAENQNKTLSDIALICYEKPSDFCHRHLVADWFNKSIIMCNEWIDDDWNTGEYQFYKSNPFKSNC